MTPTRSPHAVMFVLICIALVHVVYYVPQLPDTMTSQFDVSGGPQNQLPKLGFAAIYVGSMVFVVLLMTALGHLLTTLPDSSLNMPNKEYWLHPKRREQTIRELRRKLGWFANATLLFLIILMHMIMTANVERSGLPIAPFLLLLTAYLGYCGYWCWRLISHFKRTPDKSMSVHGQPV